jgi:hypothetical protein
MAQSHGKRDDDAEDGEQRREIIRALARMHARRDFNRVMRASPRGTTEAKDE